MIINFELIFPVPRKQLRIRTNHFNYKTPETLFLLYLFWRTTCEENFWKQPLFFWATLWRKQFLWHSAKGISSSHALKFRFWKTREGLGDAVFILNFLVFDTVYKLFWVERWTIWYTQWSSNINKQPRQPRFSLQKQETMTQNKSPMKKKHEWNIRANQPLIVNFFITWQFMINK